MTERARMGCPECGAEMNCHAEKVDPSRSADDPACDGGFGGVVLEIHTCPVCKFVLEREAH